MRTRRMTSVLLMAAALGSLLASCAASNAPSSYKRVATIAEKTSKTFGTRYVLVLPREYQRSDKPWPLMLLLHGGGGKGDDLDLVKAHEPIRIIERLGDFPFILIAPQCPSNDRWTSDRQQKALNALLDEVMADYRVDRGRVYLTGGSMGGYGTWALAMRSPERFAAVVPLCGGGRSEDVHKIKHIPVWAFHGEKDYVVPIARSRRMVDALRKCGGDVKFTIHPNAAHDIGVETYGVPALYEWLLKHRRGEDGKIVARDLVLDQSVDAEAWAGTFVEFRFLLEQSFAGTTPGKPGGPIRFSLPVRNPFYEDLHVRVEWERAKGIPWTVVSDPTKVSVSPGEETSIGFAADVAGRSRLILPAPACTVRYAAGEFRAELRLDLPGSVVDAYLRKRRPTLIAERAKAAPTIDGKLDDPVWRRKADAVDFESWKLDSVPSVRTEAWIAYDDAYCYVAMRCGEPRMDGLKIATEKRDGEVYNGDSIEIMLDTDRDRKTYYHFVVNPAGALLDAHVTSDAKFASNQERTIANSFDADVKVATAREESAWVVEVAIPWKDLKVKAPLAGAKMGFLLARARFAHAKETKTPMEVFQYPPLNGWNHRKENFGDLVLGDREDE